MATKKYKFTYEGSDYIMEFDRASVVAAEKAFDFSLDNIAGGGIPKVTDLENLFHASLLKHHPNIKRPVVEHLFELQADKSGLFQDLVEMYGEAIKPLLSDAPAKNALTRESC